MTQGKLSGRSFWLITVLLSLHLIAAGCVSDPWTRYETSLYSALKYPGQETMQSHAHLLREIIVSAEEKKLRPPPGICAEFAFYTARLGEADIARKALAREMHYYPEATRFVAVVARMLDGPEPEPEETGEKTEPEKTGPEEGGE